MDENVLALEEEDSNEEKDSNEEINPNTLAIHHRLKLYQQITHNDYKDDDDNMLTTTTKQQQKQKQQDLSLYTFC